MTASYWEIGRRIVEAEQKGKRRAGYGEQLIARLSLDLTQEFGRGFSTDNLENMRRFFIAYPIASISETLSRISAVGSAKSISETASRKLTLTQLTQAFTLPWSAYVRLLSVKDNYARQFYEAEALRGGWSVRQLDRRIGSQFYERTALSKNKAAMLTKGAVAQPQDAISPDEAIKDPYVLEFLDLKDEYSESQLEEALIQRLEDFLLELGSDFTFVGRQSDDTPASKRHIDAVCVEEISALVILVLHQVGSTSRSDLAKSVCRLIGMAAVSTTAAARVMIAIDRLKRISEISETDGLITPAKPQTLLPAAQSPSPPPSPSPPDTPSG